MISKRGSHYLLVMSCARSTCICSLLFYFQKFDEPGNLAQGFPGSPGGEFKNNKIGILIFRNHHFKTQNNYLVKQTKEAAQRTPLLLSCTSRKLEPAQRLESRCQKTADHPQRQGVCAAHVGLRPGELGVELRSPLLVERHH